MDETPEELERIRREADQIDPYRYRRRKRTMAAIGLGALGAGLVWVVLEATDQARNPCQRVRDHYCAKDPASLNCKSYEGLLHDSVNEANSEMRGNIRHQCAVKIQRLAEDEKVVVP